MRKVAFAPVADGQTRVLILGSLPGDLSLAAGRYYANPRNRFWQLVGAVIDRPDLPELDYDARLAALLAAGVGLWDAIASASRLGSLDSAIRNVQPAALVNLSRTLPQLRAMAFNGKASARIARPQLGQLGIALIDLPSSSPAHASLPLAEKQAAWLQLRQFLAPSSAQRLPCEANDGIGMP